MKRNVVQYGFKGNDYILQPGNNFFSKFFDSDLEILLKPTFVYKYSGNYTSIICHDLRRDHDQGHNKFGLDSIWKRLK